MVNRKGTTAHLHNNSGDHDAAPKIERKMSHSNFTFDRYASTAL